MGITFSDYQKKSRETAIYPDLGSNFTYPVLGLAGETGEICEKVKKVMRDKGGVIDEETRASIKKELGDVLWYLSQFAEEVGLDLGDVAEANIEKLQSRKQRGVLQGSGDNR